MQVIGRHLPSARTQLSVPFDGLELWLELRLRLELEKEFERQTKNDNKELIITQVISTHQLAHKFVYQTIQAHFDNYNIFLLLLLLYS